MKLTLRAKFMVWLTVQTLAGFLAIGLVLYFFNQHEQREHPDEVAEEQEELLIMYGLMAAVLPVVLTGAWIVSGQLLQPLRTMIRDAHQISEGQLEQRIETPLVSDELGQLARALNEAFDNYRQVLDRLERFSQDAAHQLRNPLAAMRTSAEVCLQQARSTEDYQEALGRVLEESRRLSHTVDQLLLLARLTRRDRAETFAPFDLTALVRQITDSLGAGFEAQNIEFELSVPASALMVRGAPRLLEEAVANLLDNALRFTPAGGRVAVELRPVAPDHVALSVSDSGPGLPAELHGKPLHQGVPAARRSPDGTGLGLLIVGDVARAHGGVLQADQSAWQGARFTLLLPALR